MLSEHFSNDLGNDQVVEVRLVPGDVCSLPDLARRANERALRKNSFAQGC
jgi:hypothetical protein